MPTPPETAVGRIAAILNIVSEIKVAHGNPGSLEPKAPPAPPAQAEKQTPPPTASTGQNHG